MSLSLYREDITGAITARVRVEVDLGPAALLQAMAVTVRMRVIRDRYGERVTREDVQALTRKEFEAGVREVLELHGLTLKFEYPDYPYGEEPDPEAFRGWCEERLLQLYPAFANDPLFRNRH